MENDNSGRFESVYSTKVRAGRRRTYFFDVRKTKGGDFYVTLTESTKKFTGEGYERHKIFLYKEDFNRFLSSLQDTINHVKTDLMPDYDYEQFERRQEEWEKQQAQEALDAANNPQPAESTENSDPVAEAEPESTEPDESPAESESTEVKSEDDMAW